MLKSQSKLLLVASLFLVSCTKANNVDIVEPPKVVEEYIKRADVITVGSPETNITVTVIDSYIQKIDDKAAGIICYAHYNGSIFCIKVKEESK